MSSSLLSRSGPVGLWVARAVAFACVTALAAGCEHAGPTDGAAVTAPIRITAVTVGTPISTLVVEVTATDIPTPLVFNLTVVDGVASGTIRIPPGVERTITVTAFDDAGDVTHDGGVVIDVQAGPNPPVNIPLRPRAGQVPIVVTFGNYSVVVTPAEVLIDLGKSTQQQLTVSVTGVDGQPVADPQVSWATTNPTIAAVSSAGLVTGLQNGAATIVAAYEGVAGLSQITVTNAGGPNPGSVIQNGDFEMGPGVGWQESSSHGYELIVPGTSGAPATHSGGYYAWLGGDNNEVSTVTQQVTMPAGTTTLEFWLFSASEETTSDADIFEVLVNGLPVLRLDLGVDRNSTWQLHSLPNIGAIVGPSFQLSFRVRTDELARSSAWIDDVSIR